MDPTPSSARLALSVSEFCDTCSISRSLFYQEVKAGRILTLKVGKRTLSPSTRLTLKATNAITMRIY